MAQTVRMLVQDLTDATIEPTEFCAGLEKALNVEPQPRLVGLLRKSLPPLRQSLVTGELVIKGIRPPPASVVSAAQNVNGLVT